ncbi:xylulokinase, partial [Streptomyces daliensis]|nr:xylulokinase [Streptomyces daliensis]
ATHAVRLPHDYLTGQLTGEGTTDRGDVSGTGWWASSTEAYDEEILGLVDLSPALLPRAAAARSAPFRRPLRGRGRAGALVATGTGDNMAAA